MSETLTYAKVGGPPEAWSGIHVYDSLGGEEISDVIEVDTSAGWLIQFDTMEDGSPFVCHGHADCEGCKAGESKGDHLRSVKVWGDFHLDRADGNPVPGSRA